MTKIQITLCLITVILSSCATSYKYVLSDLNTNVSQVYVSGYEYGVKKSNSGVVVAVAAVKTQSDEIQLLLWIKNGSNKQINVFPEQISILGINYYQQTSGWNAYNPDEYLEKMRSRQQTMLAIQAFNGAMAAQNAGVKTTTTSGYGTGYAYDNQGGYVQANTYTTTKSTTYDQNAANAETARQNDLLNRNEYLYAQQLNSVENGMLKRTTLFENQEIYGNVMAPYNSFGDNIIVTIPVDGEEIEIMLKKPIQTY